MTTSTLQAGVTRSDGIDSYLRLAAAWPPHLPADDADYELAADLAFGLSAEREMGRPLDAGEQMYLDAVLEMLRVYDERHPAINDAGPLADRVRGLMEAGSHSAEHVAEVAGVGAADLDEVLAGRGDFPIDAVRRLADHFRLDAGYFL